MRLVFGLIVVVATSCHSVYYDLLPIIDDMSAVEGGTCEMDCSSADLAADLSPSCLDSSACPPSAPVCTTLGMCAPCAAASDGGAASECATYHAPQNLCGPSGACVECLSKEDCAPTHQTCNLMTNACGPCSKHADCTTGVCKSGGACASTSEIAYVDNSPDSNCTDTPHTSTPSAPFCKIADATAMPSPLSYIVVAGSTSTYDAVSLTAISSSIGPILIAGPGRDASPTAKIAPAAGPAVAVSASGASVTLKLDGLELIGSGGGVQAAGLKCHQITLGTPSLTVLNSYIHNSGGAGVDSSNCTLTLDSNIISKNSGGGLTVNKGSITASNNLIVGNGTDGPGVLFQGTISGTWWFNTVADNQQTGGKAAAFNCLLATTAPVIQASIVWGNDKNSGSSSDPGCSFAYSDIDDTTTPAGGNFNMNPMLTTGTLPAAGYRLSAGSPCINKVTAATGLTGGTLPTHDVDGKARPRTSTGGYDCGASQAP